MRKKTYQYQNNNEYIITYNHNNKGEIYDIENDYKLLYEGEIKHTQRHGKGIEYLPNKIIYQGEFKNNCKDGLAIMFDNKHQNIFLGNFVDNKKDGKAILIQNKNIIITKYCQNIEQPDKTILVHDNKLIYPYYKNYIVDIKNKIDAENHFSFNKREDESQIIDIYADHLILNTENDISISYKISNQEIYQGNMKGNKYHGFGTLNLVNGTKYEGKFENGKIDNSPAIEDDKDLIKSYDNKKEPINNNLTNSQDIIRHIEEAMKNNIAQINK